MIKEFNKLSPNEIIRFRDFVNSPYFNKSSVTIKIFSYLNSKYPNISAKDLSVKVVSNYLSPDGKLTDTYVRKMISIFNNTFELFLINQEHQHDVIENKLKLSRAFFKKGMKKKFMTNQEALSRENKLKSNTGFFYSNELKIAEENIVLHHGLRENMCISLQEIEDNVDLHYVLSKVHYFNSMVGLENYHSKKLFKKTFKKEILNFIEQNILKISRSHKLLYLEYLALKMAETFSEDDENKFINYFKSLRLDKENKENEECIRLFLYKLEYQFKIQLHKKFNLTYYTKLLNLYRWSFDNGYFRFFLVEGILVFSIYFFVIEIALHEREFEWVSNFLEQTKHILDPDESTDMYGFAKATLYFHLKEYDQSFLYLNKVKLNDSFYYHGVKILMAKIFLEKRQFNSAAIVIDAMGKYYKKNKKIRPDVLFGFRMNLIFFRKLLKPVHVKKSNFEKKSSELKYEILNLKEMSYNVKTWYLKFLNELKISG